MKYDKNSEPKSYLALVFRGYNKFVAIIPTLIGILSLASIAKYPEYTKESIIAAVCMFMLEILFLFKTYEQYREIGQQKRWRP